MKTIKLKIELTYEDDSMHGNTADGLEWFRDVVLLQNDGVIDSDDNRLLLHSQMIGDEIGEVRVVSILGEV